MSIKDLERSFNNAISAFGNDGKIEDFYNFFDSDSLMINEDIPFILDKESYKDHTEFLRKNMNNLEWVIRKPTFQIFDNTTGLVTADLTVRGKPNDQGFRQRHSVLSCVCYLNDDKWKCGTLHTSTMLSHINHASPG